MSNSVYMNTFPQTVLALWGPGTFETGGSDVARARPNVHNNNELRTGITDIGVFDPPFPPFHVKDKIKGLKWQEPCLHFLFLTFSFPSSPFPVLLFPPSPLSLSPFPLQDIGLKGYFPFLEISPFPREPQSYQT